MTHLVVWQHVSLVDRYPVGAVGRKLSVGVPCAITTQLILDGVITEKGVLAPMTWKLCEPILKALEAQGIYMTEAVL